MYSDDSQNTKWASHYDTPVRTYTTVMRGHLQSAGTGYHFEKAVDASSEKDDNVVAIGLGITTRKWKMAYENREQMWQDFEFFKHFLPSFCGTCSPGFHYDFYLAYDLDDAYLTNTEFLDAFSRSFLEMVLSSCPRNSEFSLHFVHCRHSGKPARAQNDAMWEAYLNNAAYYYRINDDTILQTPNWTETFINGLRYRQLPNIGVVGPKFVGTRQKRILTYEFVHSTHFDIFGFYYPRQFEDWFGDRWISDVYGTRMKKYNNITLRHTESMGRRYELATRDKSKMLRTIADDRKLVSR